MKLRRVAVDRDTLTDVSELLCRYVIDNDSLPDEVRDRANDMQFLLSEFLCYPAAPDRSAVLIPYGFRIPQFYTELVEELILDLYGEEPTDMRSIRIMLARQSARYADNSLFSIDFRLVHHELLNELVAKMKADADEDSAGQHDEIDYKSKEFERSTNAATKQ